MTPEDILSHDPVVLTREQREFYFDNGYLIVKEIVPREWVDRLRALTDEMIERSRSLEKSDMIFDLEPGHTAAEPRLRRLTSPVEHHPTYWEYASQSVIADLAQDLVGPNVKFHHSKLNFKWASGGEEVKWHQDIGYWPHTNYSPLTIGTYLHDVGDDQGPLGAIAASHKGELFNQYDDEGNWVGCLNGADAGIIDPKAADYLTGPAGSVTIHNCRLIHGSRPNLSDKGRPLLLNVFSSADAFPYTANPLPSRHEGKVVRGEEVRYAHHDPRPCLVPPDWSGGYTSLYALQQGETWDKEQLEQVSKQTLQVRSKN